ncbi:hypothetical protein BKA70DRAFT_1231509 [Coprinopsis sp. MPI-PUGE-AT-0042]|nr:hypothetical protein BKA70DRAFT_1231509 [Coprinopsis sp. MPI-PUGE-AT-0042]
MYSHFRFSSNQASYTLIYELLCVWDGVINKCITVLVIIALSAHTYANSCPARVACSHQKDELGGIMSVSVLQQATEILSAWPTLWTPFPGAVWEKLLLLRVGLRPVRQTLEILYDSQLSFLQPLFVLLAQGTNGQSGSENNGVRGKGSRQLEVRPFRSIRTVPTERKLHRLENQVRQLESKLRRAECREVVVEERSCRTLPPRIKILGKNSEMQWKKGEVNGQLKVLQRERDQYMPGGLNEVKFSLTLLEKQRRGYSDYDSGFCLPEVPIARRNT